MITHSTSTHLRQPELMIHHTHKHSHHSNDKSTRSIKHTTTHHQWLNTHGHPSMRESRSRGPLNACDGRSWSVPHRRPARCGLVTHEQGVVHHFLAPLWGKSRWGTNVCLLFIKITFQYWILSTLVFSKRGHKIEVDRFWWYVGGVNSESTKLRGGNNEFFITWQVVSGSEKW